MLPATLQFLITMIACAINERMQRKLGKVACRSRLGGMLNYYYREAA